MVSTHSLGFPRIGRQRELKFALERYWRGDCPRDSLEAEGAMLRQRHWAQQSKLDLVPVGDFSFYDQVLDLSFMLGNVPTRARDFHGPMLDNYFRVARGRSVTSGDHAACCGGIPAGEMTKWFDTNYHYIVPEFGADTRFSLHADALLKQIDDARRMEVGVKPVLIGPITYLFLGKSKDGADKLSLLPQLLPVYTQLLRVLAARGVEWVQMDEPALVMDLDAAWSEAYRTAYAALAATGINILLTTYFGALQDNLPLACSLPVHGVHLDAINAREEVEPLIANLPNDRVLSLGVVNGRNIWKTDLAATLDWLEPVAQRLGHRLWIAPSCSLLHVPVDLNLETELGEIGEWLAFAHQKLEELHVLAGALKHGRDSVTQALAENQAAIQSRRTSARVHNQAVKAAMAQLDPALGKRQSAYARRASIQAQRLNLPRYPTTTIGSFPQTTAIRHTRNRFKSGELDAATYDAAMRAEIAHCVREQEALGLDVLVHGEAERNDMVEYFGEQLHGYAFSRFGWVQSYGSRCVKPPILFGDITRPKPMTVEWTRYAQSLTDKPMKGMLTGPVTILNWSFVRDDQPRSESCYQLALAIRDEVLDLEKSGIRVIQIDEAALREGLPLRRSQWGEYLRWAVGSFRIAANGVRDETQIHTHMCYSEFNDIIASIADMDADVITIETSRSDMELLDAFDRFHYPNEIGPGVYDIHSPNIPPREHIVQLMKKAAERIPAERLWVNPDCGLKTRQWPEVIPALANMVAAAQTLRKAHANELATAPPTHRSQQASM